MIGGISFIIDVSVTPRLAEEPDDRAHGRAGAGVWEEMGRSRCVWPATLGKKASPHTPWASLWTVSR